MWQKPSLSLNRPRLLVVVTAIGAALWGSAVLFAMARMWTYSMAPGAPPSVPERWPGSSLVTQSSNRATVIMFLHPRCTCSNASLIELQQIANQHRDVLSLWVLINEPAGAPPDWVSTSIVERARAIPNATTVRDRNGDEARRFGVTTSGHVVVYDVTRTLRFSGGITGSRGQVGDNEGLRNVVAVLRGDGASRHTHPTLGCGLLDHDEPPS